MADTICKPTPLHTICKPTPLLTIYNQTARIDLITTVMSSLATAVCWKCVRDTSIRWVCMVLFYMHGTGSSQQSLHQQSALFMSITTDIQLPIQCLSADLHIQSSCQLGRTVSMFERQVSYPISPSVAHPEVPVCSQNHRYQLKL